MTDRKHTPLPWECKKDGPNGNYYRYIVKDFGTHIQYVTGAISGYFYSESRLGITKEENMEANAEFIVRACNMHYELVEALEKLADSVDDWNVSVESVIGRQPQTGMATANARAILARARSGQEVG